MTPVGMIMYKKIIFENTIFVKKILAKKKNIYFHHFYVKSPYNCPPNAPQIRPIENFFGILKQHVYANNWLTKSRDALIRRIKKCVSEIDMNMVVKMFQNLKPKIKKAEENGLESLI